MKHDYFIGVDIGTTSTKAIAFSRSGQVCGTGNTSYTLLVPQPAWAEQDPDEIVNAVVASVRDAITQAGVSSSQIAALCVSGAMHSLIAVDETGKPLTHAIIWADNRSIKHAEQLNRDGIGHTIYRRTGTPIHPMSPLAKLMWMREENQEIFHQAVRFVSIKEYVLYQWLGRWVVDYSIASATGLFNLDQLQWDDQAIALAGIHPNQLSDPVPTTQIFQGIIPSVADAMGIDPQTPVVIGATDGVLANLGVGAIAPHQLAITIGTSGAVRMVVPQPLVDPKGRTFCYALTENHWVIGGPSNNGGVVLRWMRDRFCDTETAKAQQQGIDPYDLMMQEALQVPPGSDGLICLPFFSGERAPYWNADARGIFFGLTLHHTKAHLIRAALEGVMFAMYSITLALQDIAGTANEIRAAGGFARSAPWRQMMADVFGYEVLIPQVYESSAFGAAVLGMYAMGAIAQLDDVSSMIQMGDRHTPDPAAFATYHQLFAIYERLYSNVVDEFAALAAFQRNSPML